VLVPLNDVPHPEQEEPSLIEQIHAHKVSLLPLRNDQGSYDRHAPPELSTSAQIGDYIQGRTAAWTMHLQRKRAQRKEQRPAPRPRRNVPKARKAPVRKAKR